MHMTQQEKSFDPRDPQYERVGDLPDEHQKEFVNYEDGFVRKEAGDPILEAQIQEIIKNDPRASRGQVFLYRV